MNEPTLWAQALIFVTTLAGSPTAAQQRAALVAVARGARLALRFGARRKGG